MKRRGAKKRLKEKKAGEEVMDEEIWKEFPEDLQEVVIARLPIFVLIRFRLVCQKWNSLPKSRRFQQLRESFAQQKQPLFYAVARVRDGEEGKIGALYDPSVKEWRHTNIIPPPSSWCLFTAASAGGLVCYYDHSHASFRVGNFLTQTWKEYPWCSRGGNVFVGIVTLKQDYSQPSARGYKIIGVDSRGYYKVYDSTVSRVHWGLILESRIPDNIKLPSLGFDVRTVSIDTVVYFLANQPDGIVTYDVVSRAWEQLLIPAPPNFYGSLAECGGRILLVGKVQEENSAPFSVCVWELERAMLRWQEVDRMPDSWCTEFVSNERPSFACLGNRRVLVMSLSSDRRSWIVTYDAVSREWSKAPRFTIPRRYPRIEIGVGFFPCLSATP